MAKKSVALNDSIVTEIKKIPEVELAFPEISIPVKIQYRGKETTTSLRAIPAEMKEFPPFNKMKYGSFFTGNSSGEVALRNSLLKNLKISISANDSIKKDTSTNFLYMPADSLINDSVQIITKVIDLPGIIRNPFGMMMGGMKKMPFKDSVINMKICGIVRDPEDFGQDRFGRGIFVPVNTAKKIPQLGFKDVFELLGDNTNKGQYSSIYVRVKDVKNMTSVSNQLKSMGLNVFAFSEQLKSVKRAFLIMDSLLGAVGIIALVVAALGIINTMLMSILERTREIGIMKSIGGSEGEIKTIFFVEASVIGFIGAIFGIGLGWGVTRIANVIMNAKLLPQDLPKVDLFYFPWWLIVGAIAFSIVISLAAGLYPAIRAARIDPVRALRHD
jgi:putative ABC transport system permease protein